MTTDLDYQGLLMLQVHSDQARDKERKQIKALEARIERLRLVIIAAETLDIERLRLALWNLQEGDR